MPSRRIVNLTIGCSAGALVGDSSSDGSAAPSATRYSGQQKFLTSSCTPPRAAAALREPAERNRRAAGVDPRRPRLDLGAGRRRSGVVDGSDGLVTGLRRGRRGLAIRGRLDHLRRLGGRRRIDRLACSASRSPGPPARPSTSSRRCSDLPARRARSSIVATLGGRRASATRSASTRSPRRWRCARRSRAASMRLMPSALLRPLVEDRADRFLHATVALPSAGPTSADLLDAGALQLVDDACRYPAP